MLSLEGARVFCISFVYFDLADCHNLKNRIDSKLLVMLNLAWWKSNGTENILELGLVTA